MSTKNELGSDIILVVIKLIIFDWDDVFTHGATEGYFACYHGALQKINVFLEPEEEKKRIKAKWGATIPEEFAELLMEKPELVDRGVEEFTKLMMGDTFVNHLKVVGDSPQLLKRLSTKYLLAIASGVNPQVLREKIFTKFSFPNVFKEIITVYDLDDPEHAKPHPYMPQEIMRKLNISPEETILVGDARGDMLMARSAGVIPVAVLTGHLNRQEADKLGIKHIIENVTKLEDVLSLLNSQD